MKSLPTGWAVAPIRTLMQPLPDGKLVHQGWSPQCEAGPARLDSDWGALKTTAIQDGAYFPEHNKRLPDTLEAKQRLEVQVGDLLMTCAGPRIRCGVACLVRATPSRRFISGKMYRFRANDALIDSRLLEAFIRRPETKALIDAMKTGISESGMNITHEKFSQLVVPVAPRPEQKRIADKLDTVLTCVDAVNERLARVAPLLKRFRQSVLAAATSGRLTEDWRNSTGVSSAWQTTDVQSVAQVGTGSTPLRSNPGFFSSTGTPWVTSAATSSEIVTEANEYVTPEAIAAHRLKVFPVGTLLVAMYGEGKTRGQVTQLGIPATINQACAAVVVDESKMLSDFVKLALQANYLEMRVLAEGGNQPNLNLAKVKGFPLPLPSREEQTEIVRRVETLFAFADRLEARLQSVQTAADRLTPSLLAKAFRGELVPQDPNDEPASELLKRLAAAPATLKRKRDSKTTS
jgi:type I restriction enzyme S subunit